MPASKPTPEMEALITESKRRTETLQRMAEFAAQEPRLFKRAVASLGFFRNGKDTGVDQREVKLTHFERIKQYFQANENEWTTAPDLMKRLGLKRGAVSHVLYKAHADYFEQQDHPKDGKMKLWRLRKGVTP